MRSRSQIQDWSLRILIGARATRHLSRSRSRKCPGFEVEVGSRYPFPELESEPELSKIVPSYNRSRSRLSQHLFVAGAEPEPLQNVT